jgi:hypothetical protein
MPDWSFDHCTICGRALGLGAHVGDGDGTGQRFAHVDCFRARAAEASKSSPISGSVPALDLDAIEKDAAPPDGPEHHTWLRDFRPEVRALCRELREMRAARARAELQADAEREARHRDSAYWSNRTWAAERERDQLKAAGR